MSGVATLGMLGTEELGRKAVHDLQESTGIRHESCIMLHIQQKRRHQASYLYMSLLLIVCGVEVMACRLKVTALPEAGHNRRVLCEAFCRVFRSRVWRCDCSGQQCR